MADKKQIGVSVDEELWRKFRQDVKERHGGVRGALGHEVENAIRQYLAENHDPDMADRLRRIETVVMRMQDHMDMTPADGGTDLRSAETHTRAPDEKPDHHAPRDKKVAYLVAQLRDDMNGIPDELPKAQLREIVKEEYGFRSDTAKGYVDELRESLGLVGHPRVDHLLVTPERRTEIVEEYTDAELDDL